MLKKDILQLCLLHLLAGEDIYGYEILRQLHEQFTDVQESAVYALLRGLCKEGCLETYQGGVSGGPARKYYRITDHGKKELEQLLGEWRRLQNALKELGIT